MGLRTSLTFGRDRWMRLAWSLSGTLARSGSQSRVMALVLALSTIPFGADAQEAVVSTTVAPAGSGTASSRINFDTVTPTPATDSGLALPAFSLVDDGSGPRVNSLMLHMPKVDFGNVRVASVLGDQRLPAVFRGATLAGPVLGSMTRGFTLTTTGTAPFSLSVGQLAPSGRSGASAPTFAAAAVSFTPSGWLWVTPQVMIPGGSPEAQARVGTAVRAHVAGNIRLTTDVSMAGAPERPWAPLAAASLAGQWPRAGIETSVLRGGAAPTTGANTAFVTSRDREAVQAHVQPLPGLAFTAVTSVSRPSSEPRAVDTTQGSFRVAYDGLTHAQVSASQQRESTATRGLETTSLEWQQRGALPMTLRYVRQSASGSEMADSGTKMSRIELDLPLLVSAAAGSFDLRAALTAGDLSDNLSGVSSRLSGKVAVNNAALTGETELGVGDGDGHLLRGLRLTTEVPVVPTTRLQFSYAYRSGAQYPLGQVVEARILRRVSLNW